MKKIIEFAPGVELCFEEPFHAGPELDKGQGRLHRGYVKFIPGKSNFDIVNVEQGKPLCFPVWFGEMAGMFHEDEIDEFYSDTKQNKRR